MSKFSYNPRRNGLDEADLITFLKKSWDKKSVKELLKHGFEFHKQTCLFSHVPLQNYKYDLLIFIFCTDSAKFHIDVWRSHEFPEDKYMSEDGHKVKKFGNNSNSEEVLAWLHFYIKEYDKPFSFSEYKTHLMGCLTEKEKDIIRNEIKEEILKESLNISEDENEIFDKNDKKRKMFGIW
jgi:hypothetical protein